jgi:hypothetical protein
LQPFLLINLTTFCGSFCALLSKLATLFSINLCFGALRIFGSAEQNNCFSAGGAGFLEM